MKKWEGETVTVQNNRLFFEDDIYSAIVAKRMNYDQLQKSLKNEGGYIPEYIGELTNKKDAIILSEARENFFNTTNYIK